jgi:hypothetical protein
MRGALVELDRAYGRPLGVVRLGAGVRRVSEAHVALVEEAAPEDVLLRVDRAGEQTEPLLAVLAEQGLLATRRARVGLRAEPGHLEGDELTAWVLSKLEGVGQDVA